MVRNIPRSVQVGLLPLVVIPLGAGIGWELANLSEQISGLAIGYISAAIGGAICFGWFLLQVVFGLGEFLDAFVPRATESKNPAQPNSAALSQKEKV